MFTLCCSTRQSAKSERFVLKTQSATSGDAYERFVNTDMVVA
jgi:hypothetical protein